MRFFSSYHPIGLFFYYVIVIIISVTVLHPVVVAALLAASFVFFALLHLKRPKEILGHMGYYSLLFILISVIHPMFSHNGERILFFMNDNPITAEAVWYGCAIAAAVIGIIFWMKTCYEVMSSDKILYLLGRISAKLSLFVSMGMRFLPLMKQRLREVSQAQKTMGLYTGKSYVDRLKCQLRVFGAVLTWTIEHMDANSKAMKARGYGQKKRSNYSIYNIRKKDIAMLLICAAAVVLWRLGVYGKVLDYTYYPYMSSISKSRLAIFIYTGMEVFFFLPSLVEIKGNVTWKLLELRI